MFKANMKDLHVQDLLNDTPIHFIPNKGQWHSNILYKAYAPRYELLFMKEKILLQRDNITLELSFYGSHTDKSVSGNFEAEGKFNFFKGKNSSMWYTNIPSFFNISYENIWPGISMIFRGENGKLKYDLIVQPKAEIKDIRFRYKGAEQVHIDQQGNMVISLKNGILIDESPKTYQIINGKKEWVDSLFTLIQISSEEWEYGFQTGDIHSSAHPLIIDPGLLYSTYLGGSGNESGRGIAVDHSGHVYVAGTTSSPNFPTTQGAFDRIFSGDVANSDVFLSKFNMNKQGKSSLVSSTFVGGNGDDVGTDMALDPFGNVYITGRTTSNNFPVTNGAFQPNFNGGFSNAFLVKLNPTGSGLLYGSYLGGSVNEWGFGIAADRQENAYITGFTESRDFPTTNQAFRRNKGEGEDVFVTKVNTRAEGRASLIYSTFLGGGFDDSGSNIAVDRLGHAYVTGSTRSPNFPVTSNAFSIQLSGESDAFVTKLNMTGSNLLYSTFLGGRQSDTGSGITVDNQQNAYITGSTSSQDFPTTFGAFDPSYNGGFADAFAAKINTLSTGKQSLVYSTFIGGAEFDSGDAITINSEGEVFIAGITASANFPVTFNAFQSVFKGGEGVEFDNSDAFVLKLNQDGSELLYSSFLGGTGDDFGDAIAIDDRNNAYVTGGTTSTDFPTTRNAFDQSFNGGDDPGISDAYVSKLHIPPVEEEDEE